jgi:hypothetical protein
VNPAISPWGVRKTPPDGLALLREAAIFADLSPVLLSCLAAQRELIEVAAGTTLLDGWRTHSAATS